MLLMAFVATIEATTVDIYVPGSVAVLLAAVIVFALVRGIIDLLP